MKVLVVKGGATAGDLLTLLYGGAGDFERLADGTAYEGKGVVAEVPDGQIKRVVAKAAERSKWMDAKDLNRDLKFIAKVCSEYENGTEVAAKGTSRGFQLIPDEAGRIDRAENLAEGDIVAVGPTISPKAMMNARGIVVSVSGEKAEVEIEESDLDRIERAANKKFKNPVRLPKSVLEKV